MSLFEYIVNVMREQRFHDDDECQIFKDACELFGAKWREFKFSPTVKLHSLEKHIVDKMLAVRRLFAEDGIERRHKINNNFSRVLACIRTWSDRTIIREQRINIRNNLEFTAIKDSVDTVSKRNFSESSSTKRSEKKEKKRKNDNSKFDPVKKQLLFFKNDYKNFFYK